MNGRGYFSASSEHRGGVNVMMADGAVVFVGDTIDTGDTGAYIPVNPTVAPGFLGQSPFGVWGALGSINGGEQSTL